MLLFVGEIGEGEAFKFWSAFKVLCVWSNCHHGPYVGECLPWQFVSQWKTGKI